MECEVWMIEFDEEERKPLFLPCGHTFCYIWLNAIQDSDLEFSWPSCQIPIKSQIDDLPVNFSLLNVKLSNISDNQSLRSNSEDSHSSDFCNIHPSKKIKFWCQDWSVSFWSKCIDRHTGHNIESIESSINRRIDKDLLFLNE